MKIIHNSFLTEEQIKTVEEHYNAKYICDSCLMSRGGSWINTPFAFFYTEETHPEGSNYFALYVDSLRNNLMITNGSDIQDQIIVGVVSDNGDVVYSAYRHNYVTSPDGSVSIDGGRDYERFTSDNNSSNIVKLVVNKDSLVVINEDDK